MVSAIKFGKAELHISTNLSYIIRLWKDKMELEIRRYDLYPIEI